MQRLQERDVDRQLGAAPERRESSTRRLRSGANGHKPVYFVADGAAR
jgi:hypothetical protein